jgi:hypothetical protein
VEGYGEELTSGKRGESMKKIVLLIFTAIIILFGVCVFLVVFISTAHNKIRVGQNNHLQLLNRINLRSEIVSTPKFLNNSIYVQTTKEIIAINESNWTVLWRTRCPGRITNSEFIIFNDEIYAPDDEGNICQINLGNGFIDKIYRMPLSQNRIRGTVNGLLTSNGELVVAYDSLVLISWKTDNGIENWRLYPTDKTSILIDETAKGIVTGMDDGIRILSPNDGKITSDHITNHPVTWLSAINKNNIIFATTKDGISTINFYNTDTNTITKQTVLSLDNIRCITEVNGDYFLSGNELIKLDQNLQKLYSNPQISNIGCIDHYLDYSFGMENSSSLVFFNQDTGGLLSRHNFLSNILQNTLLVLDPLLVKDHLIIPAGNKLWVYEFIND